MGNFLRFFGVAFFAIALTGCGLLGGGQTSVVAVSAPGSLAWFIDLGTLFAVGLAVAVVVSLVLRYALGWLLLPWADELRAFQDLMQEIIAKARKDVASDRGIDNDDAVVLGWLALGPSIVQAAYWIGMVLLVVGFGTPHG